MKKQEQGRGSSKSKIVGINMFQYVHWEENERAGKQELNAYRDQNLKLTRLL